MSSDRVLNLFNLRAAPRSALPRTAGERARAREAFAAPAQREGFLGGIPGDNGIGSRSAGAGHSKRAKPRLGSADQRGARLGEKEAPGKETRAKGCCDAAGFETTITRLCSTRSDPEPDSFGAVPRHASECSRWERVGTCVKGSCCDGGLRRQSFDSARREAIRDLDSPLPLREARGRKSRLRSAGRGLG